MSQSPPLRVCARGCNEATTHFQALHRSARGAATKPQRIFKPSTALLAGLQRSHNAFSSPPPLCSRGCNEATTHFQALHRSVCAVRGPCCRHQEEGVQQPNDQQQRLSLSAARWKETEGTAIDIARQARMVSRSAPVHCGGPQRITSLLVQTSTSQLNLVINYKHHSHGASDAPDRTRGVCPRVGASASVQD